MTPRSRSRLLLLALILLMIGIGLFRYDRNLTLGMPSLQGSNAALKDGTSGETGRDVAKEGSERRLRERSLTKLRSLLELRQGELAFIRLSPATMRDLLENPDSPVHGAAPDQHVGFVGNFPKEWMEARLTEMVETEGAVDGSVDPSDSSFEWTVAGFTLSGRADHFEDTVRFNIRAKDGEKGIETVTRQPLGAMMLLKRAGPDSEGVLVVVGKDR